MQLPVNFTISDGIGQIELNRPDAANTINMPLAEGFRDAAREGANDPSVEVVLPTAAGNRLCGGGDVSAIAHAQHPNNFLTDQAATSEAGVQLLEDLDRPIVAAVHGAVAG